MKPNLKKIIKVSTTFVTQSSYVWLASIYHITRVLSSTEAFNFRFEKVGKNGKNAGKRKTFFVKLRFFENFCELSRAAG